jgi:Tfp pilus assembly protein PilF
VSLLGRLFGRRPPRLPPWARQLGDPDRFARFVDAVAVALEARGVAVSEREIRSGSVMLGEPDGEHREWILWEVASRCAGADPDAWPRIVGSDLDRAEPAPANVGAPPADRRPRRPWTVEVAPWGGVLLECGRDEVVMILLAIADPAPLAALSALPAGTVRELIVLNGTDRGHLASTRIAGLAGRSRVFAFDPARPVDRGSEPCDGVTVEPLGDELRCGALRVTRRAGHLAVTWEDGTTALVGDAIPLSQLEPVGTLIGGIVVDPDRVGDGLIDALMVLERVVLHGNLPGGGAADDAELLARLGVSAELTGGGPARPPPARAAQVIAHLVRGELDRAEQLIDEGLAAGEEVAALWFQRGVIAVQRDDPAAAERAFAAAAAELPVAAHSLAMVLSSRGDPRAPTVAREALARLPGDAMAIASTIAVHARAGDRDGARRVLTEHGGHLEPDERVRAAAIAEGTARVGVLHRFPAHARMASEAAARRLDVGDLATAETLLRRAVALDPEEPGHVAELGHCLSEQGRELDAIAVYDQAIERGGLARALTFNRGNCQLRRGDAHAAVADFRRCLALAPSWTQARFNLVSALHLTGDGANARAELEQLRREGAPADQLAALEAMLGQGTP